MPLTGFVEEVLDLGVPIGMKGGPRFSTRINQTDGRIETRQVDWPEEIGAWDIGSRLVLPDELVMFRKFHRARRGSAVGFLVRILDDYLLTAEPIGTGDGTTQLFQITQTSDTGYGEPYVRTITKPKGGTETVHLDGTPVNPAAYTLDTTKGQITFATAPGLGVAVTVSCEFYTPVRFDTDVFAPELVAYRQDDGSYAMSMPPLPIVEISAAEILQT